MLNVPGNTEITRFEAIHFHLDGEGCCSLGCYEPSGKLHWHGSSYNSCFDPGCEVPEGEVSQ
jgi:hypothetical protein